MMVIIILFNNKDYNNRTPPPPRKNCISQRASMERNEISQGELFFFKTLEWNVQRFSKRWNMLLVFIPRDIRRSAGHLSDDFLSYPDDALYRNITRGIVIMLVSWLSKQNNNKTHYSDLPARYENKRVPRGS